MPNLMGLAGKGLKAGAAAGAKYIGPAGALLTAAQVYHEERSRKRGVVPSAVMAVGEAALFQAFTLPTIALSLAPLAGIAQQQYRNYRSGLVRNSMPMSPYRFEDSMEAQTSRQRALQAIDRSKMNARSYLGNEAGLFYSRFR